MRVPNLSSGDYSMGAHVKTKRTCLESWGTFQIPRPFSRYDLNLDEPIRVSREADAPEREARRQQLETSLRQSSRD
jgi:lysophospholipid acyltransferase (LPLAT)-like uncharacterized protein